MAIISAQRAHALIQGLPKKSYAVIGKLSKKIPHQMKVLVLQSPEAKTLFIPF
jgi:hypothetical protein